MSAVSILIVEDDDWLAEQYARVLTKEGYKVSVVPHALAAVQAIDDINPDAIVLDVLLTGSTAFALLHEMQSYGDTGDIPIILCSNLADDLSEDDLEPYGVRKILDKSKMVPGDLVAALKSILP